MEKEPGRVRGVPRLSRILAVLTLFIATFVAYWPAMRNSFVWDDTALVLRDPLIRHWRLAPDAFTEYLFLDASASNFYRPMQRLTYIADYAAWGIARPDPTPEKPEADPAKNAPRPPKPTGAPATGDGLDIHMIEAAPQPGWHFTSILCHVLAAVALWRLLLQWLGKDGEAWAFGTALLWALHPLHTSAVTYVSGRADSLAACFAFTGLYFVAKAHRAGRLDPKDRAGARQVIAAMGCGFFALLSKESGVAAFTLWLVWVSFKAPRDRRSWVAFAVAVAIAVGGYLSLRLSADKTPMPPKETSVTVIERAEYCARALAEYATLFVAPHALHMERDIRSKATDSPEVARFRQWQTAGGVGIALGLILWIRWARRRAPDVVLALAAAAVTWLPMSNLFTLNATVAEHWVYVPSAFVLAAIAFSLRALVPPSRVVGALAGAAALALGWGTFTQQGYWHDQHTFYRETARRAGSGPRMLVQLGSLAYSDSLYERKLPGRSDLPADYELARADDALRFTNEALQIEPGMYFAHFNLGTFALPKKDLETAKREFAIAEQSPLFTAQCTAIRAYLTQLETGQPNLPLLADAANLAYRNWSICRQLPLAYLQLGKPDRAMNEILRFNAGQPYRAEAFRLLAECLEKQNNFEFAAHAYGDAANRDLRDEISRAKLREYRAKR
jgi:hypothetical protein